jgi:hypothetical protein
MTDAGRVLKQEISQRAPKDEGDLAAQVHAQVSRDGLSVVAGYSKTRPGFKKAWRRGGFTALWQEFGARQHAAQPFVGPAFRAKLRGILDKVDAAVTRTIKRAQNLR